MIVELAVRDLGVISDVRLALGPGMTVLTGETGAGKTLLVEALALLQGGRAHAGLVRPGADQAVLEGLFVTQNLECILKRSMPTNGRSRYWINGEMATLGQLGEVGTQMVEIHGQHTDQALLSASAQREALDCFGNLDTTTLKQARKLFEGIVAQLNALGGDSHALAREAELLRYQLEELHAAKLSSPAEEESLAAEERTLAQLADLRSAIYQAIAFISGEEGLQRVSETSAGQLSGQMTSGGMLAGGTLAGGMLAGGMLAGGMLARGTKTQQSFGEGALAAIGIASGALSHNLELRPLAERAAGLAAELSDLAADLRARLEDLQDDPQRLEEIHQRRRLLGELKRKYGPNLAEVMQFADRAQERLAELESLDSRIATLEQKRTAASEAIVLAEIALGSARRSVAPQLAEQVGAHLAELAMPFARVEIELDDSPAAEGVCFMLSANAGEPPMPLAKVASGGELARTMLALRLVLTQGPPTMVFDEVDAGIGGAAALAVGRSLAKVGRSHQVVVVTHLAQVAAYADAQVTVYKGQTEGRTVTMAARLDPQARVVELARMLSGHPDSPSAQRHAVELLQRAQSDVGSI